MTKIGNLDQHLDDFSSGYLYTAQSFVIDGLLAAPVERVEVWAFVGVVPGGADVVVEGRDDLHSGLGVQGGLGHLDDQARVSALGGTHRVDQRALLGAVGGIHIGEAEELCLHRLPLVAGDHATM